MTGKDETAEKRASQSMHHEPDIDAGIFKAYDVRGLYPEQLDERAAYNIGRGYAQSGVSAVGNAIVVGRDMRYGSGALFEAFTTGANAGGLDVIDIGLCTAPMLYFAVHLLSAAGGAMVTASHNPAAYNGFKFVREAAIPIAMGSGLEAIRREALKSSQGGSRHPGTIRRESVLEPYVEFFTARFSLAYEGPVVIDAGNGTVGSVLPHVLQEQKIKHSDLFFEPDGRFPNHEANPMKSGNLRHLRCAMASVPGSLGIAFDADGDRVCFLDEAGDVVRGDLLAAFLAPWLLKRNGGGKILYDLRSSRVVPDVIREHGGEPIKTRVGHAFIKHIMREQRALFGGELACHFYYRDFFNCDSGIYAMLHVLEVLAESGKRLSDVIAPLCRYAHSGEINFAVRDAEAAVRTVEQSFLDGKVSHLDGLSVEYADWWFNLRPSNTEPLLRLNLEADTDGLMRDRVEFLRHLLERSPSARA